MGGGPVEYGRILLPASNGSPARPSSGVPASADNPFGPTPSGRASPAPGSAMSVGGDNPFGPGNGAPSLAPSASQGPKHAHHLSADNPFGGGSGPSMGGGKPPAAPSSVLDGSIFAKKRGVSGSGAGEPPVVALASAVKLSYTAGPSTGGGGAGDAGRRVYDDEGEEAPGLTGVRPPRLDLPQLETGQSEEQLRDLAYLLFAAVAVGTGMPQHAGLLPVLRAQLGIDEARAADVVRVLRHIQPGQPTLLDAAHPSHGGGAAGAGGWRPSQRASLELLLRLITVVRPTDFDTFRGFLRWKDLTVAVLERQMAAATAGGWTGDQTQLRKLLARLHGAARRADVRGEDDFEEEEYGEATRAFAAVAQQVAAACATGLRFPWAVRVRLCEVLYTALFDRTEEGTLIDEAALVLQFMDDVFWPALGVSEPAAMAVSAWVHFSMYVGTGCKEQRLVKQLKGQIGKLASAAEEAPSKASDPFGIGTQVGAPPPLASELATDKTLCSQVANHIVDWLYVRLSDYYATFPKGEALAPLLDVFVFAARSRGDGPERLSQLLVEAVCASSAAQFSRQLRRADGSGEARLLQLASGVHDMMDGAEGTYTPALGPHLPAALAVAAVQLHTLYGAQLQPWLGQVSGVNTAVLDVFRTVNALEARLASPIDKAAAGLPGAAASEGGAASTGGAAGSKGVLPPAVVDVVSSHRRWELQSPLKTGLLQWVATQVANMGTWVTRALSTEKWKPLGAGPDASHAPSAVEVYRMTNEALEALYGMDVPMPPEVPAALLNGIDGVYRKYVTYVNEKLGPLQRLQPPVPAILRYKKDIAAKHEAAELEVVPKKGSKDVKSPAFLPSVPSIQSSPDFTNISSSLPDDVIATAACSLHYLDLRAEMLGQAAKERLELNQQVHPPASRPQPSGAASDKALGSPASQGGAGVPGASSPAKAPPEALVEARTALLTGMQYACRFLATKVIFWDGRTPWLEQLYRFHVSPPPQPAGALPPAAPSLRLDALLGSLHRCLAARCPSMPEAVRTAFARQLLLASIAATERVLLDGGACRWFVPSDVPAIEQDILKLRALFHADGEGLDREAIDGELERLRRLVPLLRTEVGPLMDLLKMARTHGTAQLVPPGGGPPLVYDESTIMRVIAHRPERNGSKLMKQLYKLGKRPK
ncbi:hypothetical protein HYH03_003401 [Edaphochlamys debaryana]|uniref:MHD2 domain-containing protein n=1 Tax=Edaphochlamys debaryana TaxID=47281 RepID=A0A836C3D0_9CHLO|nr:hypothetical protein HYH03_003401 [Edaphochlamys debaryana]|eukprot:KAG2498655.1 hypothetical protein HYH03_003401 [Edaphochlamys debaryana]